MIRLQPVSEKERNLLWNVFQKYLFELSTYYDLEMDEEGTYPYRYFNHYFTEATRKAFLIYHEEQLAGFVMLNQYSNLAVKIDWSVAEFCIFPAFRKKHCGGETMRQLFAAYPGLWEIKFSEANTVAKSFWTKIAAEYMPEVHPLNDEETVLLFHTNNQQ